MLGAMASWTWPLVRDRFPDFCSSVSHAQEGSLLVGSSHVKGMQHRHFMC